MLVSEKVMKEVEARNQNGSCLYPMKWYHNSDGTITCCSIDPCRLKTCFNRRKVGSTTAFSTGIPSSATETSSSLALETTMSLDPTGRITIQPIDEDTSTDSPQPRTSASSSRSSPSSSSSSSTSSSSTSSSSTPSPSSTTMRDSGVTHTIPNDSTITVTRHTTITQELPTTTTTDSAASSTTDAAQEPDVSSIFGTPSPTNTPAPNANTQQPTGGINTGAVVGIAVGGAFAVALIAVLLWLWRGRRNRTAEEAEDGSEPMFVDKSRLHDNIFGRRPTSASLPRHPTPHQAAGRGYGYDPFAPFGGRVDQPAGTKPPPPPDTFEMDGRGIQVVELPGTAMTTADGGAVEMQSKTRNQ